MKPFLTLLLATLCAATSYGQTIKSLGYNTTNGTVVYSGTNTLKFENNVVFDQDVSGTYFETVSGGGSNGVQMTATGMLFLGTAAAATRTNLGLGATWLTNTNVTNFRTAIGLGQTNSVTFSEVTVTNTFYPPTFSPTNLFLGAGSLRMTGSSATTRLVYKLLGASPADRTVLAAEDNLSDLGSAATARTNLGLPLPALTNTSNVTTMRALSGSTDTNHPFSGSVSVVGTNNTNTLVFSNGILQSVE
jgi:hypothetical protein